MGKPQDLPAGRLQLQIGVGLALFTYVLALALPIGLFRALLIGVIDLGCTGLLSYIALVLVGKTQRFEQAYGGLCGSSAFINLATIPMLNAWNSPVTDSALKNLADFVLFVWVISLLGFIIRHTFEIRIAMSVLISFVYLCQCSHSHKCS